MKKSLAEKYNIILIVLLFVIPLLAINASYLVIANIEYELDKKEQESEAIREAETLSAEADFNIEFSKTFKDFFTVLKSDIDIDTSNSAFLSNHLSQTANRVFDNPFPDYKLYVFKISTKNKHTDMIFYKDDNVKGKRVLCLAFEHLYNLNIKKSLNIKVNTNDSGAKALIGDYIDLDVVANEMRSTPIFTNGMHKYSWFIWDYAINRNNDVYGAILISNDISKHYEKSQLFALMNLNKRGKAIGAFIPLYKKYGDPVYQPPLDRSNTFKEWAKNLTIQEEKDIEKWLKEPLPQNVQLGNYTAYCHLGRGATHIAVILVRTLKPIIMPKWLIIVNILLCLIFAVILYVGIGFGKWLQISLGARFTLSYLLASVLPLSLLGMIAHVYLHEYMNTEIDRASTELQTALTQIDAEKLTVVKEYKTTFAKAIKDETFINLIKEKGINNTLVSDRILEIFEGKNSDKYLPLLGVKIIDEFGEGAFSKGKNKTDINVSLVIDSFLSAQINILREQLKNDGIINHGKYEGKGEKDYANKGYKAILGRDLYEDLNRYLSVPIKRKNGNLCCYQIFDIIMIDGKPRYMLFVTWDDKTLDEEIINESIAKYTLNKLEHKIVHNYLPYRIKGNKVGFWGKNSDNIPSKLGELLKKYAEITATGNKPYNDNKGDYIISVKPSYNFNDTIFVGWIDKYDIYLSLLIRKIVFISIAVISLLILIISSIRSSSVFLKPVSILKKALDEVSLGNLEISLENAPKDELGLLSNEFSKMIDDLREKERLSKLISDQAVQAIQKESIGLLDKTETFKGVALVSDIRNFTGMSEKYDPSVITALLNEHFAEMTKIISDNGGHIYKFIGDAIEAVFPEKAEFEKTSCERAFSAGCMMINKLSAINKRRENKELFTYRIGVGLCYGTMYSGSVGSVETRLDYAILGEPLKKAAKFEALSIQNPSFPLVIGENIAEKIASFGYSLKKINNSQNYSIYTIDNKESSKVAELIIKKEKEADNAERTENSIILDRKFKTFSFSKSKYTEKQKFISILSLILVFLSVLIFLGLSFVNYTIKNDLRSESEKECSRLVEQLKSEDVLKSAFESLCFELYDDLDKSFNNNFDNIPFKQKIESIFTKYEKLGVGIPKYYCCRYDGETISEENIYSNGFNNKTYTDITNYAAAVNNLRGEKGKEWHNKNKRQKLLRKFMGDEAKDVDMRSVHYRRASVAMINDEYMLIDTNKIFDTKQEKLLGFVLCGMPRKLENIDLINYYTLTSGKSLLLAIKHNNNWYFSNNFSDSERKYLKEAINKDKINERGYYSPKEPIKIDDKSCYVYSIKKELLDYNNSFFTNYIYYLLVILLLISIIWFINNKIDFSNPSISAKLRIDILLSVILPIITLSFLSYLYVNEDFNVKKAETREQLNKLIDEIEEREHYYLPLCKNILDEYAFSEDLRKNVSIANSDKNRKEEIINKLRKEIKGKCLDSDEMLNSKIDPHFAIREIDIIGKNDFVVGGVKREWQSNYDKKAYLSDFGKILAEITNTVYFKNNKSNLKSETKKIMIVEQILKALNSIFGNMFTIKIINFPNNLISVNVQYTTIGLYVSAVYSDNNPNELEYVLYALMFFDNEFKSTLCGMRNDNRPFKDYIASGSIGDELYCFYSPNIYVGEYFFYTPESETRKNNYINKREDLKTTKELGLVSSWINSSYLPVSRNVDIYGKYLIEARQGNLITENVYAAITSEYSIRKKSFGKLPIFGLLIFFFILMIYSIAQLVINDLLSPVKRLIEGAKSVEKGDYKFRTNFYRGDELGVLCDTFDKMLKGLEEKQIMNRMVSKTALNVTSNYLEATSKKENVVLLYVAIPHFDSIMSNTYPDKLFMILRRQIALISEIVINAGGDIDKIMGEKLLIAFHNSNNNLKEVAIKVSKIALLISTNDKLSFKVSVGVNCGQVISGYLGVGEKRDFTIIGDPVNVTARIESLAEKLEENRCLISESIYNIIKDDVDAELYGEVELKGKSEAMKVYRLS